MHEQKITIKKTARYFLLGEIKNHLNEVWLVCHGYGQLASEFLQQFAGIQNNQRLVVAPEGLSRFYWKGFSGKIGASWMTRENRLDEIEDYIDYLDGIYQEVFSKVERRDVKFVVMGFSQGTATVCRWLIHSNIKTDSLIIWAGQIPPELDLTKNRNLLQKSQLSLVVGNKDTIAKPEYLAQQEKQLRDHGIPYQLVRFDGGHHLDDEVLQDLANGKLLSNSRSQERKS